MNLRLNVVSNIKESRSGGNSNSSSGGSTFLKRQVSNTLSFTWIFIYAFREVFIVKDFDDGKIQKRMRHVYDVEGEENEKIARNGISEMVKLYLKLVDVSP